MEHNVRERLPATMKGFEMDVVMRRSLVGYHNEEAVPMLRVFVPAVRGATSRITQAFTAELKYVSLYRLIGRLGPFCKSLTIAVLHATNHRDDGVRVFETQYDTIMRFSLDSGIRCGNWLEVALSPGSSSRAMAEGNEVIVIKEEEDRAHSGSSGRSGKAKARRSPEHSHVYLELTSQWDVATGRLTMCGIPIEVHAFSKASRWGLLPPLRTICLSINRLPTHVPPHQWHDGECPDPLRAISVITTIENGNTNSSKRRMVLLNGEGQPGLDAGIGGHFFGSFITRVYGSEKELLAAFQELMLVEDPSLLTGFEVGEALRVMMARAEGLKMPEFGLFARRPGAKLAVKTMVMYSARWAKTKTRMSGLSNQVVM